MPVVNFKDFGSLEAVQQEFDSVSYVGRANPRYGLKASPLANPYRVNGQTDRKTAIELYRQYLWGKIREGDTAVINALREIGENTAIVCWCSPKSCHGDVVERAAAWLRGQEADRWSMPAVLKAITLWQPWAELMMLGLKLFETRSWATDHRGPLAIHAAKRKVNWREVHPYVQSVLADHGYYDGGRQFNYGSIIGVGNLTGCYRTPTDREDRIAYHKKADVECLGAVLESPTISEPIYIPPSEPELLFGDYSPGRFAWHMPDVRAIKPVECGGAQRLWTIPEEQALTVWSRYCRAAAKNGADLLWRER